MRDRIEKSFTLLEVLVVILTIMFLIGAIFMASTALSKQSGDAKTRAIMKSIEIALENYKNSDLNGGQYPSSIPLARGDENDPNFDRATFMTAKYRPFYVEKVSGDDSKGTLVQFFDMSSLTGHLRLDIDSNANMILDAYMNPLIYRCPGAVNQQGYDLISTGSNGIPGGDSNRSSKSTLITSGFFQIQYKKDKYGKTDQSRPYLEAREELIPFLGTGDDITNFSENK